MGPPDALGASSCCSGAGCSPNPSWSGTGAERLRDSSPGLGQGSQRGLAASPGDLRAALPGRTHARPLACPTPAIPDRARRVQLSAVSATTGQRSRAGHGSVPHTASQISRSRGWAWWSLHAGATGRKVEAKREAREPPRADRASVPAGWPAVGVWGLLAARQEGEAGAGEACLEAACCRSGSSRAGPRCWV